MAIKLNFINESNDVNNSTIVIFQDIMGTDTHIPAIAWKVIENSKKGDIHPFVFPDAITVSTSDSNGNHTPQLLAKHGDLLNLAASQSGEALSYAGPASNIEQLQVRNGLTQGAIDANVYRGGKLLAVKTGVVPGQVAAFQFKPAIRIGVANQVEEGEMMNDAIVSGINTELSLVGIASADIVMTGGGDGSTATSYKFQMLNVKHQ